MYQNFDIEKECYDKRRKDVCDAKGNHKPNHCNTVIICLLEKVLAELCEIKKCCGSGSDDSESVEVKVGDISTKVKKK